jgi:penicillin-binding protein 1A
MTRRRPAQPRTTRPEPKPRPRTGILRRIAAIAATGVALLLVGWVALFLWYAPRLPDTDVLFKDAEQARVRVLAADGSVLAERGTAGRPFVRLEEISPWLVGAVVATEDRRFWEHSGIDPVGLARALVANLRAGGTVEGGSTITQQLAKNLYLTPERTLRRKLEELVLAIWLEARLTKEQILTLYLNRVYLGAGAYGVEAASQRYFGKPAKEVSLQEAALMAGLLRAPSRYAPTGDLALARERAATVLRLMADQGVIDEQTLVAARTRPAKLAPEGREIAGWFIDWVLEGLTRELGKPTEDLVVQTTLDRRLQEGAERAVAELLPDRPGLESAVVLIDREGAVRAMVGGRNYRTSPYNRAVSARRQPGSAFKPFVFLTALDEGWRPTSAVRDAPIRIKDWQPGNNDGRYHGSVSLTQALALSLNSAAVRLGQEVGIGDVVQTAHRLGIETPLPAIASLPLGTGEVTPLELTRAYLPFATSGLRRPEWGVVSVKDKAGRERYRHMPTEARVIEPEQAAEMARMLRAVVTEGTGTAARIEGRQVAGKTGTTQNRRDAWFVGFSGDYVAGVWVGYDDARAMRNVSGSGLPARIWRAVMLETPASETLVAAADRPRPEVRKDNGLELLMNWVQRTFGSATN